MSPFLIPIAAILSINVNTGGGLMSSPSEDTVAKWSSRTFLRCELYKHLFKSTLETSEVDIHVRSNLLHQHQQHLELMAQIHVNI